MRKATRTVEIKSFEEAEKITSDFPIVIADELEPLLIMSLVKNRMARHIVQKSNVNFDSEIELAHFMEDQTGQFMRSPLLLIIKDQDSQNDWHKIKEFPISKPQDKNQILDELEQFGSTIGVRNPLIGDIRLAADELITNAVYNAPFVDDKTLTGPSRNSKNIKVDSEKKPVFFMQANKEKIAIGVRDFYGTLNASRLINRIYDCYLEGLAEKINFGPGGAGLGAFLIFRSCSSMYVAIEKKTSCVICCAYPYKMPGAKRENLPKNFHWIEKE